MPNQYDSAFKSSASRDPRAMLFLAGRLALEGPERIDPFEREIVTPQRTLPVAQRRGIRGMCATSSPLVVAF